MLTKNLPLRATCAALAGILLVAGCGGSGSDGPTIKKTPTSAAPTTPAATTPSASERSKDDRSDAGAIEFSAYVIDRVIAVTSGADADEVLTIASDDCEGCINLAKDMQKNGTIRQQFDGPPQISGAAVIDTSDDGSQYLVEQKVVTPAGSKVDTATGDVKEALDEATFTFRVLMTWETDKWILTNYSAKKSS